MRLCVLLYSIPWPLSGHIPNAYDVCMSVWTTSGSGRSPAAKRLLVHFELRMMYLVMMDLNELSARSLPVLPSDFSQTTLLYSSLSATQRRNCGYRSVPFPSRQLRLRALEKGLCSPSGSWRRTAVKRFLVHFYLKMKSLAMLVLTKYPSPIHPCHFPFIPV